MIQATQLKEITKTLNVLFVEDDINSRMQFKIILEMLFASVALAVDGLEGWKIYQKNDFDLVITDISMPNMDGIELTKKIKEEKPTQKIVIVSAHDNGNFLLAAIQAGVDNFVLKPVEISQFEAVIEKVARSIHYERLQHYYQEELEQEVTRKTVEIMHQSMTDSLTGLSNRNKLKFRLSNIREKKVFMLLNIDNFDNINVSYGYTNGDAFLKKIALFFQEHLHPSAEIYRLSADSFGFLFNHTSLKEAEDYAKRLQSAIREQPIVYEAITIRFTATIVLTEGFDNILQNAYLVFKETRLKGKNRIGIYQHNPKIIEHQHHIQNTMHTLSEAFANDQIVPYFQPIYNNTTQRIEKFECLARIKKGKEIILPHTFLETAEMSGRLSDITRVMIQKSFLFFKNRQEDFSINITEQDLNDDYLALYLKQHIAKYGINPSRVIIEVLEGISSSGAENNFNQLLEFKKSGFKIAIDDFGAQHSNFERVHRLQVDFIKIDGSFIKNIDKDINSFHIARTITDFSKSIGAQTIAEFVHNEAVQKKVLELGIGYSQGYYFAEPSKDIREHEI